MSKALIEKAFEKWFSKSNWNKCMNICAKDAWNACAEMMRVKVEELEKENKRLNMETLEFMELCQKGIRAVKSLQDQLSLANKVIQEQREQLERLKNAQHEHFEQIITDLELKIVEQQEILDKAVETIRWYAHPSINQVNYHATMGTKLTNKAEQFLSSLDKPKEEEEI